MDFPVLYLRKGAERRLRAGHLWVYSNEEDTQRSPLPGFEPGSQVQVRASNDKPMGIAFVNTHALICGRLISRDADHGMTPKRLTDRMEAALSLRERLFHKPFYRWVFGDSDGLSGLVVDRFDDVVVVQISTAGMEQMKDAIVRAVQRLAHARIIVLKNDGKMRKVEGLDTYVEFAHGPEADTVLVEENGARFECHWLAARNRLVLRPPHEPPAPSGLCARQESAGCVQLRGWLGIRGLCGLSGYLRGRVFIGRGCVHHNAKLNGLENVDTIEGDAFDALKALADEKEKVRYRSAGPPALIPAAGTRKPASRPMPG